MRTTQCDKSIGQRLRVIRKCAGVSRKELANTIGISSQQIHKYENGENRITVSTLLLIADALKAPLWDFIQDEEGNLLDTQEQRAIYQWRALSHPVLQTQFIDLMQEVNRRVDSIQKHKTTESAN